ncbi:MAG: UDP-N-acetylmuramate--L-alanine ligase [Bacilli bacterium]|nr:UDP-N-acetylmuramate--L-alanine ligase [Bacilli bacterium]
MKYYCIGIKGAGMSTLANILHDLGNDVTGYDDSRHYKFTEDGLRKRNIDIYYEPHDIDSDTIVTYSKAFSSDHPEIKRVRELGLKVMDYNQVVGSVTALFETVGVSGTHGKTTTSLLISHIIKNTLGCSYFVGDGTGFASKDNKIFVIESDEYNKHFLAYHPHIAVVTNIELDHTECYPGGLAEIKDTFRMFGNKSSLVVACGDDNNIRDINFDSKVIYYGFNDGNDVVARNIKLSNVGSSFDVYINGSLYGHFDVPLFGKHMILNSLAAIVVCDYYNISVSDIIKYMRTFVGAKRRFVTRTYNDIVVVDDYAHHPTEIRVTLEAARQKYPKKKIVAIHLPNTYSRTLALMDDFVDALRIADKTYVMDIYCDREKQEDYPDVSSDQIISRIPGASKVSIETVDELLKYKDAVMCFMSCGNIYLILEKYEDLLKKKQKNLIIS